MRTIDPKLTERIAGAIADVRAGKMVILVDDEDRENEGDLTMAAQFVTPEAINFMATHGRGLICVTLNEEQVDRIKLPMMQQPGRSGPALGTAFTVSIEARRGVTTGISAADRAHTIRVAASPEARPEDVVTPGHVFPLRARKGGVLVRTGQTEGSVDLARLADLTPAGVICEIMNDDGTMARMPDLERFAEKYGLRILTIEDLIQYRLFTERLMRRASEATITLDQTGTEWQAIVYESTIDDRQFVALVKGNLAGGDASAVPRAHGVDGGGPLRGDAARRREAPARGHRADRAGRPRRARLHRSARRHARRARGLAHPERRERAASVEGRPAPRVRSRRAGPGGPRAARDPPLDEQSA